MTDRKTKLAQPYIVGTWVDGPEDNRFFQPELLQPEEKITDLRTMIAWAKSALGSGTFSFVREVPGTLEISTKEVNEASFVTEA